MTNEEQPASSLKRTTAGLARLPTGGMLFLILSAALLPLALIAMFATLQTNRTADLEAAAQLRVATAESSRALAIELSGDMAALRAAVNALEADPQDEAACARAQGIFAQQFSAGTRFAITDTSGTDTSGSLLCGVPLGPEASFAEEAVEGRLSIRIIDDGLLLGIKGGSGRVAATAFFPTDFLAVIARPVTFPAVHASELRSGDVSLPLARLDTRSALERRETHVSPLGIGQLDVAMTIRSAPITSPVLVSMLLPLVMWALAAGVAWFVVDRLLIRPLRRLQSAVSEYAPGEVMDDAHYGSVPAREIRQLGDTFREITQTVRLHEADLAAGLVRQMKLTREVHHRVKNNLQVIASLINFHARSAPSADAAGAYASIQRRVDALAVVHRYHFAEMEDHRGLEIRSVIGELASNIRATAPTSASRFGILLEVEPLLVSQDTAVAVAFFLTEILELAISVNPETQIRISLGGNDDSTCAVLRVSSPALVADPVLEDLLVTRYGRVMTGLARQLRAPLHHDPMVGAYEIVVAIQGHA
jgi:two-component sensor histidine kinase